jgi:hypothetical protein
LTLPGPLLKLGPLGGDDGLQLIVWLLHLSLLSSVRVLQYFISSRSGRTP